MKNKRLIVKIEGLLNKTPNIGVIMVFITIFLIFLSAILSVFTDKMVYTYVDPFTSEISQLEFSVISYLKPENLIKYLSESIIAFANMTTTVTILVTLIAFGIAEKSGLLYMTFKKLLFNVPKVIVTGLLVFVGLISSVLSTGDLNAGYLILLPVSAFIFMGNGRNPLAGIATMFAAIFTGFSINFILNSHILLINSITNTVASDVINDLDVLAHSNRYLMFALIAVGTVVITFLTESYIVNILPIYDIEVYVYHKITEYEKRGLIAVLIYTSILLLLYTYWLIPESVINTPGAGMLIGENNVDGSYVTRLVNSTFVSMIVVHISFYLIISGTLFGLFSKKFKSLNDVIKSSVVTVADHAEYFVLAFIMSQMLYILLNSGISLYILLSLTKLLSDFSGDPIILVIGLIGVTGLANLVIPSSTMKWGVIAPIIIPVFIANSLNPVLAQSAFQIGDSFTNTISLVMPYTLFAYVLFHVYAVKTKQHYGNGTFFKLTAPYSLAVGLSWTIVMIVWILLNAPLANGVPILL